MATLQQLERALINADAAGDTEAARTLASEILKIRGATQSSAAATKETPNFEFVDGAWYRNGEKMQTPKIDPTTGMSTAEKFFAGMGGKVMRGVLGVKDLFVGADEELAAARKLDKPLYSTGAGALGGFAGDVSMSLPFLGGAGALSARALKAAPSLSRFLTPNALKFGVPTAAGAAEFSTLQGTTEDQSRLGQALTGGLFGVGGVKAGDVLSGMGRSIFGRAQDAAVERAQKAGYQVSSAVGGRSSIGTAAQKVAGDNPSYVAAYRNQANTDRLAKEALGITLDDPIETGITQTKQPYNAALDKIKAIKNRFSPDEKLTQDLDEFMADYDDIIEAVQGLKKRDLEGVFMGEEDAFNPKQLVEISRYLGGRAKKLFKSDDTNQQGTATRLIQVKNVIDDFLERKVGSDLANEFAEARTKYAIASNVENAAKGEHVDAQKLAGIMGGIKSKSPELNAIRDAANAIPDLTGFSAMQRSTGGMLAPATTMITASPAVQAVGRTYPTMMGAARAMSQPITTKRQPMGIFGGATPAQLGILGLGLGGE